MGSGLVFTSGGFGVILFTSGGFGSALEEFTPAAGGWALIGGSTGWSTGARRWVPGIPAEGGIGLAGGETGSDDSFAERGNTAKFGKLLYEVDPDGFTLRASKMLHAVVAFGKLLSAAAATPIWKLAGKPVEEYG